MSSRKINWYKYAAPANFYPFAGKLIPWFAVLTALLFIIGLYVGFFVAPTDFQQGEAYRIIFIHVPAAWMGMFLYVLMAVYAAMLVLVAACMMYSSAVVLVRVRYIIRERERESPWLAEAVA